MESGSRFVSARVRIHMDSPFRVTDAEDREDFVNIRPTSQTDSAGNVDRRVI